MFYAALRSTHILQLYAELRTTVDVALQAPMYHSPSPHGYVYEVWAVVIHNIENFSSTIPCTADRTLSKFPNNCLIFRDI